MAEQDLELDENNNIIDPKTKKLDNSDDTDDDTSDDNTGGSDTSDNTTDESGDSTTGDEAGLDDNEREEIRARRRQERHDKKEAQKEREAQSRREREMLRKENEELASRLATLERRAAGSEFAQLDQAINQTGQAINFLKEQISVATAAGDGATVAEAMDKLYQANRHSEHLQNVKRQAVSQTRQTETRSPIDPSLRQRAEKWMGQHKWYDPTGSDADSKIALTVDQGMAEEGWDPRQEEYWSELDARLNKYLPHRFAGKNMENGNTRERQRSPVASGGRETANSSTSGWKLSADRVAAIKEVGAWDDPTRRDTMIKNYRAYDKQNQK